MSKYRQCDACKNRYYDVCIRECVKKSGRWVCLYCCQRCKWHYKVQSMVGCRAMVKEEAEWNGRV